MKVIIAGGRNYEDYATVVEQVKQVDLKSLKLYPEVQLVLMRLVNDTLKNTTSH
jgi:hypothetical protein